MKSENFVIKSIEILKAFVPEENYIYEQTKDLQDFGHWLNPSLPHFGLPAAIHESLHLLDNNLSNRFHASYSITRAMTVSFNRFHSFPRSELFSFLPQVQKDSYADLYLLGPGCEQGIEMLLEELNAYTHSCFTALKLVSFIPSHYRFSERDGLASFMYFLILYLRIAYEYHQVIWNQMIKSFPMLQLIDTLWCRAKNILSWAFPFSQLGLFDKKKMGHVFHSHNIFWIEKYLLEARRYKFNSS